VKCIQITDVNNGTVLSMPIDIICSYKFKVSLDTGGSMSWYFKSPYRYENDRPNRVPLTEEEAKEINRFRTWKTTHCYRIPMLSIKYSELNGSSRGGTVYNGGGHEIGYAERGSVSGVQEIYIYGKMAQDIYDYLSEVFEVAKFG